MSLKDALQRRRSTALPVRQQGLIFAFLCFLISVMVAPAITFTATGEAAEGAPLRQGIYIALLLVFVAAARPLSDPTRLLVVPIPTVVALAWCFVTLVWSIDVEVSVRRLALTAAVIWSVFLTVRYLTIEQMVTLVRSVLIATLIANLVAVFAFPEYGIHQFSNEADKKLVGDWRGIMMSKNIAGAVCSVTVIYFLFGPGRLPHWIRWPVVLTASAFLFLSQSKTSGIMLIGAIFIALLYVNYKSRYRGIAIAVLFMMFVATAVLVTIYANPIKSLANDPTAFTGRMQIWTMLLRYAADNNYVGAGFGAFWSISESPVYSYANNWVATIHSGHSGYLDLLVTVGAVGVMLVVGAMIIIPVFNLLRLPFGMAQDGALPLAVLFFGAGQNATETSLFDRDAIVNVFMLIAIAMIAKLLTRTAEQNRNQRGGTQRSSVSEAVRFSSSSLWEGIRR